MSSDEQTDATVSYFAERWTKNFKKNKKFFKKGKTIRDIKFSKNYKAVIVGLHPQYGYDDIIHLKKFKGEIICTNETLRILLENDIIPSWCVAIDAHQIIYNFFDKDIIRKKAKDIKIVLPTTINYNVANLAVKYFKEVYWGHPYMPSAYSFLFPKEANKLPELMTGGNCGSMAYILATKLGCTEIGVLGFGWMPNISAALDENYMLSLDKIVRSAEENGINTYDLVPNGRLFLLTPAQHIPLKDFVEVKG